LFPPLPIQFRGDDVQTAEHGHHVADLMPEDQTREQREVDERRGTRPCPIGDTTAVGNDVEAQLTVRRLGRRIDLVNRRLPAAVRHDQLEVLDQSLDAAVNRRLIGQHQLALNIDVDRPRGQVLDALGNDLDALEHLLHAHQVTRIAVTSGGADDLEVEFGIGQVWHIPAQVADDAAGPGDWTAAAGVDRLVLRQDTDAARTLDEDAVAIE